MGPSAWKPTGTTSNGLVLANKNLPIPSNQDANIHFLMPNQLELLCDKWREWAEEYEQNRSYRLYIMFLILRWTGARPSEVVKVNDVKDIDIKNQKIKLETLKQYRRTKTKRKKKDKDTKYRVLDINNEILGAINQYKFIFPQMTGKILNMDTSHFRRKHVEITRELGLSPELQNAYVLRHSRAIELVMNGVPVTAVSSILGHKYLSSTMVYTNISPDVVDRPNGATRDRVNGAT